MSDLYNLKISVDGLTETLKQLNEFNREVSRLGNDTSGLKNFQRELNASVRQMNDTANRMISTSMRMVESSELMLKSIQVQGKAVESTMKGVSRSTKDIVSDKLKNFDWSNYLRQVQAVKNGYQATNAEIKQLLKQTGRLQAVRKLMDGEAFDREISKRFGSNAANYLKHNDLSEHFKTLNHRRVELATAASKKEFDARRKMEEKALQESLKAMEIRSQQESKAHQARVSESHKRMKLLRDEAVQKASVRKNEAASSSKIRDAAFEYDKMLGAVQHNVKLQASAVNGLDSQIARLRKIEAHYQKINQLQGSEAVSEKRRFLEKYGDAAFSRSASNVRTSLIDKGAVEVARRMNSELMTAHKYSSQIHGVWRGIAASTGNLWLSWGNFGQMAAGLALGSAAFQSLSIGREFGWQMELVGVAAETGKENVEELKKAILELGSQGALYGPVEMASALRVLSQAGLKTKEALEALPTTLKLSLVAEVDTERSALFLAGLRSSFNLEADATGKALQVAADQTAKAAAESQTSIEQMMESMKQASSEANKFGVSVSDASTALALLARVNITGSSAGTALKNLLTDLGGRTEHSRKALQELGISAYNAAGMVKPFSELIRELQERFKGMTDKQRQDWMRSFLNERGMRAANVILNTSIEEYERLNAVVYRSSENMGYTTLQAERLANTAEGSFRSMKSAWQTHFASVGTDTEEQFKSLMIALKDLANSSELRTATTGITKAFVGLGQAATIVALGTAKMSGVLVPAMAFVGTAGVAAMTRYTVATWKANAATTIFGRSVLALKGASAALMANPIALSLGAIAAVGTAAWMYYDKLNPRLVQAKELLQDISDTAGSVSTEVYEAFNKGLGRRIDDQLGIGIDVDKYNATVNNAKKINKELVLESANSAKQFQDNLIRISTVLNTELTNSGKVAKDTVKDASTYELEQRTMLYDRYRTLLTSQLEKFDQHHSDIKQLSGESARVRENYEIQLDGVIRDLMASRTQLAIQQMRDVAAEAIRQQSVLSTYFDTAVNIVNGSAFNNLNSEIEHRILQAMRTGDSSKLTERQKRAMFSGIQSGDITERGARAAMAQHGLLVNKDALMSLYRSSTSTGVDKMWKEELDKNPQKFYTAAKKSLEEVEAALEQFSISVKSGMSAYSAEEGKALTTLREILKGRMDIASQEVSRREHEDRKRKRVEVDYRESNNRPSKEDRFSKFKQTPSYAGVGAQRVQLEAAERRAKELESTYNKEREFYGIASQKTTEAYTAVLRQVESLKNTMELANYDKQIAEAKRAIQNKNMPEADKARAREDLAALQAGRPKVATYSDAGFKFTVKYDHVRYGLGKRDVGSGVIDCSGFVAQLYEATVKDLNKHLGSQRFDPNKLKGKTSAEQIKMFAANTIATGSLKNMDASKILPGMLIGTDNGQKKWEGRGRYRGIDHIVMVVQGPNGQKYASQSSSGKGVNQMPLQQYLNSARGTATVVDPLASTRGQLGGQFASYAGLVTQSKEFDTADKVLAQRELDALQKSFNVRENSLALQRHQLEVKKILGQLTEHQVEDQQLELDIAQVRLETERKISEINKEKGEGNAESARLQVEMEERIIRMRELFEAQRKAQTDWRVGLAQTHMDMINQSNNYAKAMADGYRSFSEGLINSLGNAAVTGKLKFKDMAASIASDLAKIAVRMAALRLISSIGNAIASGYSDYSNGLGWGSTSAANKSDDAIGTLWSMNWSSEATSARVHPYARGGVVNSTTYFPHSRGTGMMGENGAEGILPLSRMANGDLGVQAVMGGGGSVVNAPVNVVVNITSDGEVSSDVSSNDKQFKELGENVRALVTSHVASMLRPGGLINNAINKNR